MPNALFRTSNVNADWFPKIFAKLSVFWMVEMRVEGPIKSL
jgi:hypothetical protein